MNGLRPASRGWVSGHGPYDEKTRAPCCGSAPVCFYKFEDRLRYLVQFDIAPA